MDNEGDGNTTQKERLLRGLNVHELKTLAKKLGLENYSKLNKEELKALIINECSKEEIEAALGIREEKPKKKWWKNPIIIIGLLGSIASIIGLVLYIQGNSINFSKLRNEVIKNVSDPKLQEESLRKIDELEKLAKKGDKKERQEALEALGKGNFKEAEEKLIELRKREKAEEEQNNKDYAKTAYILGSVYFLQLKFKDALASYLEAEGLDPENAKYKNLVGICYLRLGRYQPAKDYFEKALDLNIKIFGEDNPHVATIWNNLGAAYNALGQYDRAIQYFKKALAVIIKIFGESHPNVATVWNNLGGAYRSLNQYVTAIKYYKKALPVCEKFLGNEHPHTKTTRENLEYAQRLAKEKK